MNCMVDSEENYKFDLGVKGLKSFKADVLSISPLSEPILG